MGNASDIRFDEEKHIYTVDGVVVPSVTDILSPITASGYSKINPAVLEHAAMKGTLVHEWCEMYDYGCAEDAVPSELIGYCQAYMAFVRDYRPKWEMIEEIVTSHSWDEDKNDTRVSYAGRLDRMGEIDGKKTVVDIKTIASPSTRTHISVCCQTAAYAWAIDDWNYFKIERYALYLKPDGSYRFFNCREYEEKNEFDGEAMFFTLLSITEAINKIGRRK